jgi:hypothetical protein
MRGDQQQRRHREQDEDDAGRRGDTLAAAEAEVDREEVAEERRHAGGDRQGVGVKVGRRRHQAGEEDRQRPLRQVEAEDEEAVRPAEHPADVRRAEVAAAFLEDIDAPGPRDEVAERDRPDQVGRDGDEEWENRRRHDRFQAAWGSVGILAELGGSG